MSLRVQPCFRSSACCCRALSRPRARAITIPTRTRAAPATRGAARDRRQAGPVRPRLADAVLRAAVTRRRRSSSSAPRTGTTAETELREGDASRCRATAGNGTRRKYMLALARANQGKWNDAGQLFEELFKSYPKLAPYHAYNAARCRLRRGDAAGALEWAARVADGSVPEGGGGAGAHRCAAHARRAGATRSPRWRTICSSGRTARAAPRRCSRRRRRWRRRPAAAAVDARKAAPDVTAIYRRVWAEAPLDGVGRPRRRAPGADRRGAAQPPRRRSCARAPRAS